MAVSLKFKGMLPGGNLERSAFKKISIPRSQDEADLLLAKSISEQSITAHYQKQMEKLVQEYVMMRQLDTCPNIVTCQDLSYVPNGYGWDIYFRMELLHPLKQVIQNSYAETDVIQLGIDICSALIACESVKIIHRDIKPDNIMVSSDGTFKLGDFGIAKTSEKTQTGTMAGTYNYMAPEVANRKRYGLAADIYSLGMVLYWMMNNKTMPFLPLPPQIPSASQKQQALNRRFSGEQLPEPQNGSRELKEIVAKACAYAPEDRYHSALEMRNALEALSSSKQAWTKAILEELALPEDILHESNRPIAQRAAAGRKTAKIRYSSREAETNRTAGRLRNSWNLYSCGRTSLAEQETRKSRTGRYDRSAAGADGNRSRAGRNHRSRAVQQKKRCQQPPKRKVQPLCCCRMLTALTRLRRMA